MREGGVLYALPICLVVIFHALITPPREPLRNWARKVWPTSCAPPLPCRTPPKVCGQPLSLKTTTPPFPPLSSAKNAMWLAQRAEPRGGGSGGGSLPTLGPTHAIRQAHLGRCTDPPSSNLCHDMLKTLVQADGPIDQGPPMEC